MSKVFNAFTAGDLGDICYLLATLKHVAEKTGPVMLYYANRGECKAIEERAHLIAPLIESQPYIAGFKRHDGETMHWLSNNFRYTSYRRTKSLVQSHLENYLTIQGLPPITPNFREPWITGVSPDAGTDIIINRSPRYHNHLFPWREIVNKFGPRIKFIGLTSEHEAFCQEFGNIPYLKTETLLDAARAIAGSSIFIGNQSSCFAVAEGMKRNRILEVCQTKPDVIVASNQPNCQYSCDGSLTIENTMFPARGMDFSDICTFEVPPRGWCHPHPENPNDRSLFLRGGTFAHTRLLIESTYRVSPEEARLMLCSFVAKDNPGFFKSPTQDAATILFQEALANAV